MRNSIRIAVLGALMFGATGMASAATNTSVMTVNTIIAPECALNSPSMYFPVLASDVANGIDQYATANVTVQCTIDTPFALNLDQGTHSNGSLNFAPHFGENSREMTGNNGAYAAYRVYTNASHTNEWLDATGFNNSGVGDGLIKSFTAYGVLLGGQVLRIGDYQDNVTVTAVF
jgi:spore coat protein U-like protein